MPNPLVAQGSLNKLRASITWSSFPALNVTASFLSKEGIRIVFQGDSVTYMPTMTGQVTSLEPYMGMECTVNLVKSQPLANLYKQQMELNALLGDGTIRPDAVPLSPYQIINASIKGVRDLDFSGEHALFAVQLGGYYLVNSSLFN